MCFCYRRQPSPQSVVLQASSCNRVDYAPIRQRYSWFNDESPYYTTYQLIRFYSLLSIFGVMLLSLSYYFLTLLTPWDWKGSPSQLWGVTGYTYLFPIGFMMTMTGISGLNLIKEIPPIIRAIITAFFAICSLFISIFFLFNGYQNHLYQSLHSLEILVLWAPISIILMAISIRMILYQILIGASAQFELIYSSATTALHGISKKRLFVLLIIIILLPLIFIATTLLPNTWLYFDTKTIKHFAKTPAFNAHQQWTVDCRIGHHYLHLYFDTILFYGAIFLTAFVSFIIRQCLHKRYILSLRKIIILCDTFYLSIGNVIVLSIWIPVLALLFYYWAFIHSYGTNNAPIMFNDTAERISRSFGILSCVCIGLLLIPVTRSNVNRVLEYCFGIEFQEGIVYHKCLGVLFLIFSSIHYVTFSLLFITNAEQFVPYINIPWIAYHSANFTVSLMYGVLFFIIIPIFFVVTCFTYFRRYYFELFYYLHLYGAQVVIIAVLFHAHNAWYYILPGLILQFVERLYRMYNCTQIAKIVNVEQISSVITKLEIAVPHKYSFASGKWSAMNNHPSVRLNQYCFINIPNISPLQWHPFSISNPLTHPSTVFYIKNMHRGWTKLLNNIAAKSWCIPNLNIGVEGPYGVTLDFENYERIVLIAGGVGITTMHNVFFSLYHETLYHDNSQFNMTTTHIPSIDLWWINRSADAFSYYIESFRQFQSNPVEFMKIKLFATRERRKSSFTSVGGARCCSFQSQFAIDYGSHRPYLPSALSFMKQYKEKGLIYVCGPSSMVTDSLHAAYNNGNHFRREYFLW